MISLAKFLNWTYGDPDAGRRAAAPPADARPDLAQALLRALQTLLGGWPLESESAGADGAAGR